MKNLINQLFEINQEFVEYPDASLTLSILGTQSSGKSTLLNAVFGSVFPVLDTSLDRARCTRGVWLHNIKNINLLDTQGFDSAQRNEDEKIFEKEMSLFCVAISDVILINVFMHEVGRYSGGHLDILEAIFKVGERLVTPHQKKIIYIIRDCTEDADQDILSNELTKEINSLANHYKNKNLKYTIQYYFMSHYVYQPEVFIQEAKQLLPKINIKKPSPINNYKPEDRVKYLHQLWDQIKDSKNEIDLKSIDDALKNYVMERLKKQVLGVLQNSLKSLSTLEEVKSYQRFNQVLYRDISTFLGENKPTHMKQKQLETYCSKVFEQFEPSATKHFNTIVLKNIENELKEEINKQIQRNNKNKRLSHLIFKKKKEITDIYKKVISNHKEYSLLIKNFHQLMENIIGQEERKLNHLFSIFEANAENELNKIIDHQANNLTFKQQEVNNKIKSLCQEYQYNQWEVNFKDIWEKVSYRCLEKLIPEIIKEKSIRSVANIGVLAGDQTTNIIAVHTNIETRALNFCRELLLFMHEQNTFTQPLCQVKELIRQCLIERLNQEQRRWKISWLLISILMLLLYGELQTLLGWTSMKKKKRKVYMRIYFWSSMTFLAISLWKQFYYKKKPSK